jgi:hypothetical protein
MHTKIGFIGKKNQQDKKPVKSETSKCPILEKAKPEYDRGGKCLT